MKLLFNLKSTQPMGAVMRHGGGIYGEVVFRRLIERGYNCSCAFDSRLWLNPEIMSICEKYSIELFDLSKQSFQEIVNTNNIDVLYSPLLDSEISSLNNCKIIVTIHGLRGVETPNDSFQLLYSGSFKEKLKYFYRFFFKYRWHKHQTKLIDSYLSNKNIKYVTVSEHTKFSLLANFPLIEADSIHVFYTPDLFRYVNKLKSSKSPFFLLVSANRWEKNNLRAIIALDELFSENRLDGYTVKICGALERNFNYKIKNRERFEFKGYVSDEELNKFYSEAYCLIYPTLNEGFGSPPIEFMSYGKPVLASPFTSVSTICGGAPLYFNPFDILEIKNRILMSIDKGIYEERSRLSKIQYEIVKKRQDQDLDSLIDYIFIEK